MKAQSISASAVLALLVITPPIAAQTNLKASAAIAVDPDCTAQQAVKWATMKVTVGVGNRCVAAEVARDVNAAGQN